MLTVVIIEVILIILMWIWTDNERIRWQKERNDLVNRIQAGSLTEYQLSEFPVGRARLKDDEQRAQEEVARKGISRDRLKMPSQWSGW